MTLAEDASDLQAQIFELQSRDTVTGLYNRSHFMQLLALELEKDFKGIARALLYLRPDAFGEIAERFGPLDSDILLRDLARTVEEQLGEPIVASRFGGTIFTVLLERSACGEINELAEKLRTKVADSIFEVGSHSTAMTLSIGVLELSNAVSDAGQAIFLAQATAREARQKGGNCVVLNHSLEVTDDGWAGKIRWALANDAFQLVYQPIASLKGDENNNYDVLLRMRNERGEELMPGEFLPAAERTGLMPVIDRWVIERAFVVSAARCAEGKETRIFIRVSDATLHDPAFFGWLSQETLSHQMDPDGIVLQVSERTAEHSISLVRELAEVCHGLHFQLSLSNSGAARNGVQLVEGLDINYLALDGSLIRTMNEPEVRRQLAQLIVAARTKQIPIIAASVENAAAIVTLYSLGVDYVTGYHVHEPEVYIMEDVEVPDWEVIED